MSNLKFKVQNGNALDLDFYEPGETPYVSATTMNNGIKCFVQLKGKEKIFKSGSISIASEGEGSIMYATVQKFDFIAIGHGAVQVIPASELKNFSLEEKLILCSLIRSMRWKFSRGRKPMGRLSELPFTLVQIKELAKKFNPKKVVIQNKKIKKELIQKFLGKKIGELFTIINESASVSKDSSDSFGSIAVIGASEQNNGIIGFTEKKALTDKDKIYTTPMITVATNGKPGIARVQESNTPYILAQNVLALNPKQEMSLEELFIIASLIENQSWRFDYSRTAGDGRITELVL